MPFKPQPLAIRIAQKIIVDNNGCHVWQGKKNQLGYGRIQNNSRSLYVHRATYEIAKGAIPPGLVIDHLCRNTSCCNPSHLEAVTDAENFRRGTQGGAAIHRAQTHCKFGHEFTPENILASRGVAHHRQCRTCHNDQARARRRSKREATHSS